MKAGGWSGDVGEAGFHIFGIQFDKPRNVFYLFRTLKAHICRVN